jgi:putative methyltransferase
MSTEANMPTAMMRHDRSFKFKKSVYLSQISIQYGSNSLFLPYSVGCLWSYAQTIPSIAEAYTLTGWLVRRDPVDEVVSRLDNPAVLGLSCYMWNEQYSLALAKAVKEAYPDCLIILGGPQVPDQSTTYGYDHPYVDLLVHGEGELTFADILLASLESHPDYKKIPGLTVWESPYIMTKTLPRERMRDLSGLPSPYLTGLFDELLTETYDFTPVQETNRGCSWSCAMCNWGSAVQTKVRQFSDTRLYAEIEWFGQHHLRFLHNADANFGMFPRDVNLCHHLVDVKCAYGYPQEMMYTTAKNSNDRVFEVVRILHAAHMDKGVTLSYQSLDPHTLDLIKRSNIKIEALPDHIQRYRQAGIATYTEMILGLPGETYESFANGLSQLIDAGQHDSITVYLCRVLSNAEMAQPDYLATHGIKTVYSPTSPPHATPNPLDPHIEYSDIVVETAAMPLADWQRAYLFAWAVQAFHCMGLSRLVAMYLHQEHGVSYKHFYEGLIDFAQNHPWTMIGHEYAETRKVMLGTLQGQAWDIQLPQFGNVVWPTEESSFLKMVIHKDNLFQDMRDVVQQIAQVYRFEIDENILGDLLGYQSFIIRDAVAPQTTHAAFLYRWPDYFFTLQQSDPEPLIRDTSIVTFEAPAAYYGDYERFAREVCWFGRKGGNFYYTTKG